MSIAPIVRTTQVKAPPAKAFDLFAGHMEAWWPKGMTIGANPHAAIVIEPFAGGRWFERDAEGAEVQWGKVLEWAPPSRLLLAWQINTKWSFDESLASELELTFTAADGGGTLVRLEHRHLERFGADASAHAEQLRSGWHRLFDGFASYADAQS